MKNYLKPTVALLIAVMTLLIPTSSAQTLGKYNYAAQQRFIPAELRQVYLGMPLRAFASKLDLSKAEADGRFEFVEAEMPFEKGNVSKITFKIGGITESDKALFLISEKVVRRSVSDEATEEYADEIQRIVGSKAPASAFVYEIAIQYKDGFDLKGYVQRIYGKPTAIDDPKADYHFFTMQWTKRTADRLIWLIRYHEKTNALQLCGRITGTEWALD